jgi:hypothetical protein
MQQDNQDEVNVGGKHVKIWHADKLYMHQGLIGYERKSSVGERGEEDQGDHDAT